jgi:hypothetical protein
MCRSSIAKENVFLLQMLEIAISHTLLAAEMFSFSDLKASRLSRHDGVSLF